MPEYLGQAVLDVEVAPGRVAYLISEGSREGFRRAVREACTRWGGQTEPIVPVGPGGELDDWWRQVAEIADVEAVVNVDLSEVDAAAVASTVGVPLVPLAQIDHSSSPSSFTVPPSWIDSSPPDPTQAYVLAAQDAPLWQVVVAGDLTEEHMTVLNPTPSTFRQRPAFPVQRVPSEDQIARSQLGGGTLVERTVALGGECWASPVPTSCPALVWVTKDDDLNDCVWFWNLRALRPLRFATMPMILLPFGAIENWLGFAKQFASVLARPDEFCPDVIIGSHTVEETALHQVAAQLGLQPSYAEVRAGRRYPAPAGREAPFTYLTHAALERAGLDYRRWLVFQRRYGTSAQAVTQLFRDSTLIRFDSPVPFAEWGFALLRLSGAPFAALPRRACTAALVHPHATWHDTTLQLQTNAQGEYSVQVRVPRLADAVGVVLSSVVREHRLSDKGKIGAALHANMDISILLRSGVYEAVVDLTTPRAARLQRELRNLHADGVPLDQAVADRLVADWGHRSERRYRNAAQVGQASAAALEALVDVHWAERGFEIACTHCGIKTFVPMAEVPTRGPATCGGCRAHQAYTLDSTTPQIVYRLDALVDRASDQGVLPHLLVIAALTSDDPNSSLLPGVDLTFPDGHPCEVDVFGVHQARVLTGEVKTQAADFTHTQLTRDVALSTRLGADIHLLAAIDTIPTETHIAARALCDDAGLELLVLDAAQLRPNSHGPAAVT